MDFFDLIKELRKGEANINKAGKAMKILAWVCILGGLWNAFFEYLVPFETPFNLPPNYPYLALTSGITLGILFLISSKAILNKQPLGRRLGQVSIVLFVALIFGCIFFMFPKDFFPVDDGISKMIKTVFFVVFFLQFGIPAYFGIRYLGRLPVSEGRVNDRFEPENITKEFEDRKSDSLLKASIKYKDSVLPFGILGTFVLIMLLGMVPFFILMKNSNNDNFGFFFFPAFIFIFFTPIIYNYLPSPFQKQRKVLASYTGGGSINLFNGSWPFFRLFVYNDGLEIRVMLHRFFVPYDKMSDPPEKLGFFNRGIFIESDLPGVPSGIRYSGFGMNKVIKTIKHHKSQFEAKVS